LKYQKGTAAIEFAFAIMILLMLALGAYEWAPDSPTGSR
jgi:Flp pilus assembly protein TadG